MITQDYLKSEFDYDSLTGVFTNRIARKHSPKGAVSGGIGSKGYRRIKIGNVEYSAHRLAWMYVYGSWPSKLLDHIDRNRLNNAISNLREVSYSENRQNLGKIRTNRSGFPGVVLHKPTGRWQSQIGCAGKKFYLGLFDSPETASKAYFAAKEKLHTISKGAQS